MPSTQLVVRPSRPKSSSKPRGATNYASNTKAKSSSSVTSSSAASYVQRAKALTARTKSLNSPEPRSTGAAVARLVVKNKPAASEEMTLNGMSTTEMDALKPRGKKMAQRGKDFTVSQDNPTNFAGTAFGGKKRADMTVLDKLREGLGSSKSIRKTFREFDKDKDGSVDAAEFRKGLGYLKLEVNDSEFSELMGVLDKDGSGEIDYNEFAKTCHEQDDKPIASPVGGKKKYKGKSTNPTVHAGTAFDQPKNDVMAMVRAKLEGKASSVRTTFRQFDVDQNGSLDQEEFRTGLTKLGVDMDDSQFGKFWGKVDPDGDGEVEYALFAKQLFSPQLQGGIDRALEGRDAKGTSRKHAGARKNKDLRGCDEQYHTKDKGYSMEALPRHDILHQIAEKVESRGKSARMVFRDFDEDYDGTVSHKEFRQGLSHMGFDMTDKDYGKLIKRVDKDNSGEIDYLEFADKLFAVKPGGIGDELATSEYAEMKQAMYVQQRDTNSVFNAYEESFTSEPKAGVKGGMHTTLAKRTKTLKKADKKSGGRGLGMMKKDDIMFQIGAKLESVGSRTNMRRAFKDFDSDRNGTLDHQEFRGGLATLGFEMSDKQFTSLIKRVDNNNSGEIDYDEFTKKFREPDCDNGHLARLAESDWHITQNKIREQSGINDIKKVESWKMADEHFKALTIQNPDIKAAQDDDRQLAENNAKRNECKLVATEKGFSAPDSPYGNRNIDGRGRPKNWNPATHPFAVDEDKLPARSSGRLGVEAVRGTAGTLGAASPLSGTARPDAFEARASKKMNGQGSRNFHSDHTGTGPVPSGSQVSRVQGPHSNTNQSAQDLLASKPGLVPFRAQKVQPIKTAKRGAKAYNKTKPRNAHSSEFVDYETSPRPARAPASGRARSPARTRNDSSFSLAYETKKGAFTSPPPAALSKAPERSSRRSMSPARTQPGGTQPW